MLLAFPALHRVDHHHLPGDAYFARRRADGDVRRRKGTLQLSEEDRQRIIASLGLDKPIYLQYVDWLKDIVTLKLGQSFWRSSTVMDLIMSRGPITLEIAIISVLLIMDNRPAGGHFGGP